MHDTAGRLVAEVEPSSQLRSHFVYATESHSPDYLIKGGTRFYFAKDQLGSIRAVINADTGVVAQAIHYDEFGKILSDTNPGFQPFGFASGHFDYETGLVRFGARDYDAEVGRWTARDPILFSGGDVNLYRYVASDPINAVDPQGTRILVIGTMKEQEMIWRAIGILTKSKIGNELIGKLHNDARDITVQFGCDGSGSRASARNQSVSIDRLDIGRTFRADTPSGTAAYSLSRILAHEFGHITGTKDNGINRMNNVNDWENKIMYPIESMNRIRY